MKKFGAFVLGAALIASAALYGFGGQTTGQIDRKQLKTILEQLGYEVKDLETTPGKEKYSTTVSTGGLDIPIGFELSGNSNYIWLTVNLGDFKKVPSSAYAGLLRGNFAVQPAQFYVTKSDLLMIALPIENRAVSNALIRMRADKIADDVADTKDLWQVKS